MKWRCTSLVRYLGDCSRLASSTVGVAALRSNLSVTTFLAAFGLVPAAWSQAQDVNMLNSDATSSKGAAGAGSFQTNLFTGQFTYTVPIQVAPARHAFEPSLGLAYSSSGGNGWCGVGWQLQAGGYIERDQRFGSPVQWTEPTSPPTEESLPMSQYDSSKGFIYNFLGQSGRLINTGGFVFRPEIDTAGLRFEPALPFGWVTEKNGTRHYFCSVSQTDGRVEHPDWTATAVPLRTYRWYLSRSIAPMGSSEIVYYWDTPLAPDEEEEPRLAYVKYNPDPAVEGGFLCAVYFTYQGNGFFDPATKELRGFNCVEQVNEEGVKTLTYFHQGGGIDKSPDGEFQDAYGKQGIPYRTETWGADGLKYAQTINKVIVTSLGSGRVFPNIAQTVSMTFEGLGDSSYRASARRFFYDSNLNKQREEDLGEVLVSPADLHSLTEHVGGVNDTRYMHYVYATVAGNADIVDHPERITLSSDVGGNVKLSETRFAYFPSAASSGSTVTQTDSRIATRPRPTSTIRCTGT